MEPLTHHEILRLVEPFTRRGRHVDLAASDRLERRLVFKPVAHDGETPHLREVLQLENPSPGRFGLTRILTLDNGLEARLETEGADPAELLARIESIAPRRQIAAGPGYVLVHSHRLEAPSVATATPRMIMTRGEARAGGLTVLLKVSRVPGVPAELDLVPADGDAIELPEDLVAVLGWPWSRLTHARGTWSGTLRLAKHEPERSRDAEARLERTAQHLSETLAESPRRFHERFVGARWRVTGRRAIPLLAVIALFAATAGVPQLELADNSIFRMLIFHAPPLLLLLFFSFSEMPRIEIPPLPRPLKSAAWRKAQSSSPSNGEECPATR